MNRVDFMEQLESLLQNISPAEREEALQYYNEYFNDAGKENEQDVIEALGNPAKVAENIKRDLFGSGYGDNGYQEASVNDKAMVEYTKVVAIEPQKENQLSIGIIVLIVVLCIFASPFLAGVLGMLAGLLASWFALILGFGLTAAILLIMMLVLIVVSIMCFFHTPLVGIVVLGSGLICGGMGILFLMLTVAMAGIATPAIFRGIANLCGRIFGKKETA